MSRERLPRNVRAVSAASFLTDVSSEMVTNLLPLFLVGVLGARVTVVGLVDGVGDSIASLLQVVTGRRSDRMRRRKPFAVAGYSVSTVAKAGYVGVGSWSGVAGVRWLDRVGKGIRTSPRDALVADSVGTAIRGRAFGFHRAADTLGAAVGIAITMLVIVATGADERGLDRSTFRTVALLAIVPSALAVAVLALGTREPSSAAPATVRPRIRLRTLGPRFDTFLAIVAVFTLGNSSDSFLILRARERGAGLLGTLGMLVVFNLVYAAVSTPAGALSDRWDRRRLVMAGWLLYAVVYLGFALARSSTQTWILFASYGLYYGLTYGTAKAFIADLVPPEQRGTAYGIYNAMLGALTLPASMLAGLLWQGIGPWSGFGPAAPFYVGAALAFAASGALAWCRPRFQ